MLKAIKKSVGENEEEKLKGIMTLIGDDAAALKDDADVTIVLAKDSQVVNTHTSNTAESNNHVIPTH